MISVPELSVSSSRAIDEIFRTSTTVTSNIADITLEVRKLFIIPTNIEDIISVLQGYTYLIAKNLTAEETVGNLGFVMDAIFRWDVDTCDSLTALAVLKALFAIGKDLYSTAPGKLEAATWTDGDGRVLSEKVRMTVAVLSSRFAEDFEVMEVIPFVSFNDRLLLRLCHFLCRAGEVCLSFHLRKLRTWSSHISIVRTPWIGIRRPWY